MAKKFTRAGSLAIGFAATVGMFCGCTDTNSAGVWTETESGQQASIDANGDKIITVDNCGSTAPTVKDTTKSALLKSSAQTNCISFERTYAYVNVQGTAMDENGTVLRSARIRLSSSVADSKETTTDDNGVYELTDVAYKATYYRSAPFFEGDFQKTSDSTYVTYFDYKLLVVSSDSTLASVSSINFKDNKRVSEGDSVYLEVPDQIAGKTVSVTLPAKAFKEGDNACLDDIGVCHVITADEIEAGTFVMNNVPKGVYQQLCATQSEKLSNGEEMTSMRCAALSEPIITKDAVDTLSFELPDTASSQMDSLEDKAIDGVLVSVKTSAEKPYIVSGKNIAKLVPAGGKDLYWAEISFDETNTAKYVLIDDIPYFQKSSVIAAVESLMDTTLVNSSDYWNRDHIGFSFKVKTAGSELEEAVTLLNAVDSTESGLPRGYEVVQCEAKSENVCVRIYSGLDSVVTDTVIYGKSDILDGDEHIFTMVLAGSHLSVAVDGKILRDTDLKIGDDFYYYKDYDGFLKVGDVELNNFVLFNVSYSIRNSGETNWGRLKAWLITHQLMSLR